MSDFYYSSLCDRWTLPSFSLTGIVGSRKGMLAPMCLVTKTIINTHTLKKKKPDLLGVIVKGGCAGTKACFAVRDGGGILPTCQVLFALWENGFCQSFLIVICRLTRNLGCRSLRTLGGTARGRFQIAWFCLIQTALPSPRLHSDHLCGKMRRLLSLKSGLHGRDSARQ